ncbi:putative reverse transcriptase, RNA-dependent DNA polymerase [Helianthus anomalus]
MIVCAVTTRSVPNGPGSLMILIPTKSSIKKEFEMTDLGVLHYFLGMEVRYENGNIILSQQIYAKSLLEKFKMGSCNAISTPMDNDCLKKILKTK